MRLALLIAGIIGCTQSCIGPARADQAQRTLRALCGTRGEAIAELVRMEAHRHLLHPVLLARVIAAESTCRPGADSGHGDIGLGQIRVGTAAAKGATREELEESSVNVRLTAAHLARCLTLCGDYVLGGLSVYRGYRKCRDSAGSRRVLGMVGAAKRMQEARS